MPETILEEAARLIDGDRKDTYDGTDDTIVGLWSAYLGVELTVLDYANLMVLMKVARTKGQYHRDSYVDIAGYAGVGPRLWEAKQAQADVSSPRVWQRIVDVPGGVRFMDNDGDVWRGWVGGRLYYKSDHPWGDISTLDKDVAPFTEVLDG